MPKSFFKSPGWDKDVPLQDSVPVSHKEKKLENKTKSDIKLHKINDESKPAFKSINKEKPSKKINKSAHKNVTEELKANKSSSNMTNGWNIESVIENVDTKLSIKKKHKIKKSNVNPETTQGSSPMLNLKEKTKKRKINRKEVGDKPALAKKKKLDLNNEHFVGRSLRKDKITGLPTEEKKVKAANDFLLLENEKPSDLSSNQKVLPKKKLKVKPYSMNYVTAPKNGNKTETSPSALNDAAETSCKLKKLKAKRKRKAIKQNSGDQVQEQSHSTQKINDIKADENIEKATKIAKVENKKNKTSEIQEESPNDQPKCRKQKMIKRILEGSSMREAVSNEVKLERVSFRKRHLQTGLRARMMEKLKAAQFRFLNEKLYLSEGKDAKELFQTDPDSYSIYHEGFRQQMKKWPINPLDIIIKQISVMSKDTKVADLGCGDGVLAKSVPQKVRSFDLVSSDPSVEACDMAHTPLLAGEVNVVVFCLALMGTNMNDYLIEANRVLKIGGTMKIAEVESRFQDVEHFIQAVEKFGFSLKKKDLSHNIFYFMDFKKHREVGKRNKLPYLKLKPCLYKKR